MNGARQTHIAMPDKVKEIIRTLRGAGFEAWAVGGASGTLSWGVRPGTGTSPPPPCRSRQKSCFPGPLTRGSSTGP